MLLVFDFHTSAKRVYGSKKGGKDNHIPFIIKTIIKKS